MQVLRLANAYRRRAGGVPPIASQLDRVLGAISLGAEVTIRSSRPAYIGLALSNIRSMVRTGGHHLGRCRECDQWMLVWHAGREFCTTAKCQRAQKKLNKRAERHANQTLDLGSIQRARRSF